MAGEFVILQELNNIYHWTNVILPILFCSPLILWTLTSKFLTWIRGKSCRLKWEENYIQRLSISLGHPKPDLVKN